MLYTAANMMRGDLMNLPPGKYAIGLSGGADSTALLLLLHKHRLDIALHIVHLNHQTRGEESDGDEHFVAELAAHFNLPRTIARRTDIEPQLTHPPKNKSAFFRALRFCLFAGIVKQHQLTGVLLPHHADDQAETVLHRLLRGSSIRGLRGMAFQSTQHINDQRLVLFRPLLSLRRNDLRRVLEEHQQSWREDSSNRSNKYFRNRLRVLLQEDDFADSLRELGDVSRNMSMWIQQNTPHLAASFRSNELWDLSPLLAESAARFYLRQQGCPSEELTPVVLERLISMANDAATPARQMFPGNITLRRRRGVIGK